MKLDPNAPAFPVTAEHMVDGRWRECVSGGLPVRAELAARAMQGLISGLWANQELSVRLDDIASDAVAMADALIAELNRESEAT